MQGQQPPAKRPKLDDPPGTQNLAPVSESEQAPGQRVAHAQGDGTTAASNVQELVALKHMLKQAKENVLRIQRGGQRVLDLCAFHAQAPDLRDQVSSSLHHMSACLRTHQYTPGTST